MLYTSEGNLSLDSRLDWQKWWLTLQRTVCTQVRARKVQDVIAIIRYVIEAAITLFAVTISSGVAHHYRSIHQDQGCARLGFVLRSF
jgi:hypothetical protein